MASKITSLKELVTTSGVARTYNWKINFPSFPAKLVSNLKLSNSGILNNLDLFCKEVPLPAKEVELIEVAIKYQTYQVNGKPTNFGTISPNFVIDGNWDIYKIFRGWADLSASNNEDKQESEYSLKVDCYVIALDGNQNEVMTVKLKGVFCSSSPEVTVNSDSGIIDSYAPTLAFDNTEIIEQPETIQ